MVALHAVAHHATHGKLTPPAIHRSTQCVKRDSFIPLNPRLHSLDEEHERTTQNAPRPRRPWTPFRSWTRAQTATVLDD